MGDILGVMQNLCLWNKINFWAYRVNHIPIYFLFIKYRQSEREREREGKENYIIYIGLNLLKQFIVCIAYHRKLIYEYSEVC